MKDVKNLHFPLIVIALFWAGTGCQSLTLTPLPKGANATEEIDKLHAEQESAIAQQVDALSPSNFKNALKSLDEATKSRDAGDKPEKTLQSIAEGRAYLKKAWDSAALARTALGTAVQKREEALQVNAPQYAKISFDAVDEDFKAVTRRIEENDTSPAEKNRDLLAGRYQRVKTEALREFELGPARMNIEQAQNEQAAGLVPITLSEATKLFKEANLLLDNSPDDPAAWEDHTAAARIAAVRLLKFTRDGKALGGRNPESVLLLKEANEEKIATKTAALDQMNRINVESQSTIKNLEDEKGQLANQQKFNGLFTKAQDAFSADEAEVFKQGNKLVMRLKGFDFSNGTAVIEPKNYALLNKVGPVAQSFGKSTIVIEGHTDAVGSAASNQQLSEKRAAAVAQYLEANSGIAPESIKTTGYGYQKPIATNKTAKGRAQNRRVDIIIEPQDQTFR